MIEDDRLFTFAKYGTRDLLLSMDGQFSSQGGSHHGGMGGQKFYKKNGKSLLLAGPMDCYITPVNLNSVKHSTIWGTPRGEGYPLGVRGTPRGEG